MQKLSTVPPVPPHFRSKCNHIQRAKHSTSFHPINQCMKNHSILKSLAISTGTRRMDISLYSKRNQINSKLDGNYILILN